MKFNKTKRTRDKFKEGFRVFYTFLTVLFFLIGIIMCLFENYIGGTFFGIGLVMSFFYGIFE
tara:strand:- start:5770 stop:5955 length:186 start_codon:yes stop_codon:yes gene_type:complete